MQAALWCLWCTDCIEKLLRNLTFNRHKSKRNTNVCRMIYPFYVVSIHYY